MYQGKADLDETPAENLFGSDPGHDEARGPSNPHHFIFGEDRYVPIDEVPRREDGLIDFAVLNCFAMAGVEDPEDREDRLFHQDPSEPLGPGETVGSVKASRMDLPFITVDPDYEPICDTKAAVRNFGIDEFTPIVAGVVVVSIKKFDKKAHRFMRTNSAVPIAIRRHRTFKKS